MTSVQVSNLTSLLVLVVKSAHSCQDVFIISDGAPGALAELERRKFTAEEGVGSTIHTPQPHSQDLDRTTLHY